MLTLKEVAQMYGVHKNTVRKWVEAGLLKVVRITPRVVRVTRAACEAMTAGSTR